MPLFDFSLRSDRRNIGDTKRSLFLTLFLVFFTTILLSLAVGEDATLEECDREALSSELLVAPASRVLGSRKITRGMAASFLCIVNIGRFISRVLEVVKKFDRVDANKHAHAISWHGLRRKHRVTEKADFRKDLNLDSLDRVELVMAIEQEFSVEIPDEKG